MELEEKINEVLDTNEVPEDEKIEMAMLLQMHPEMMEMFE